MKNTLILSGLTITLTVLTVEHQPALHVTVVAHDDGDTSDGTCHLRDATHLADALESGTEGSWTITASSGTASIEQHRYPELDEPVFFTVTDGVGTGYPLSPQDRAHLARELRALSA